MRLPGKEYDDSARRLREEFLEENIDIDQFLKENGFQFPRTKNARFKNQMQTYAIASIVIEHFWEYLKQQPVASMLSRFRQRYSSMPHIERVRGFSLYCGAVVGALQNQFLQQAKKRNQSGERTREDVMFVCFFAVARQRHRHLTGIPFPSNKDLLMLFTRMAQIAPAVFERDVGREASREEIFALLRHPSILRFFVEMMSNDRHSMFPLFAKLEGHLKPNLNDNNRVFGLEYFEIHDCEGKKILRLKPAVIEEYRSHYVKAGIRRTKRRKSPPSVLGCPALYTGRVKEMYDWTCDLFEQWV